MQALLDVLTNTDADLTRELTGAFLLLMIPTLLFFIARVRALQRAGKTVPLRSIAAFDQLRRIMGRSAESGRAVHISLGTGAIGDATTGESLAALTLLDALEREAAVCDAQPIVTVADPTLLLAAQDQARRAFARPNAPTGYDATRVRLVAPDKTAYAAGVMDILDHEPMEANVMLGAFGEEYLLMAETGARKGFTQVGGATDPSIASYVYATTKQPLLGEEIFAAAAYVGQAPAHLGSLLAQDWMRVLLIIVIIVGAVLYSLA